MTRGRKKDLTIPPTRALAQQRDYRARKAQYVSQLEDRCRAAENDNQRLRKELELARAGAPSVFSHQTAEASAELLKHLSAASTSLSHFQHLAFPNASPPPPPPPGPSSQITPTTFNTLRPASFPSPAPSPPAFYPTPGSSSGYDRPYTHRHTHNHSIGEDSHRRSNEGSPSYFRQRPLSREATSRSPSLGSEYSGGFMDCSDPVEEDEERDELQEDDDGDESSTMSMVQTSRMRSTSDERRHSEMARRARSP